MKKKFVFLFGLIFLSSLVFSQNYKGSRLAILPPGMKNFSAADTWLADLVHQRLSSNIGTYTGFVLIDTTNEYEIKKIQRKSQDASFDEETAIEAGKLVAAQYVLFSTIIKDGSKYNLSCSFTNVTTGEIKPFTITGKKNTAELYDIPGCAADEMTIKFCETLKIELSNAQKYNLQYGEASLTYDEQLRLAKEEEESFNRQIADFDAQIRALQGSTKLSATAEAQKLKAERAMAEEKLRASKEKAARLLEEAKKQEEDKKYEASRSAAQKQKRDAMAQQAEEKAKAVRKLNLENQSILAQINVIEAKKKALVDIRQNIELRVEESNESLTNEMNTKISEIENTPYRIAELVDGKPTEVARANRNSKINSIKADYNAKISKEESTIRSTTLNQERSLFVEIHSDYKTISKSRTLSSLENDMKYSVGNYNGQKYTWPITLYIYSNGISLTQQTINLKYSDLTGQDKIPTSGAAYEEYMDNVDLYDSFFRRGDPVLTFEIDYYAEAKPDNQPSEYTLYFSTIRVKDTLKGKTIATFTPTTPKVDRAMKPAYDIRTFQAQKEEKEQKIQQEKARVEAELRKEEAAKEKRKKEIAQENRYDNYRTGRIAFIQGDVNLTPSGYEGFDIDIGSNISFFTWGATFGSVKRPDALEEILKSENLFKCTFNIGLNFSPQIFYYPPTFYILGNFGGVMGSTWGTWIYKDSDGKEQEKTSADYYLLGATAGLQIPLGRHFYLYGQASIFKIEDSDFKYAFQAGLGVNLWSFFN